MNCNERLTHDDPRIVHRTRNKLAFVARGDDGLFYVFSSDGRSDGYVWTFAYKSLSAARREACRLAKIAFFIGSPVPAHHAMNPRRGTSRARHQIITDGITVWINNADGRCIGRFGRMGIDIHQSSNLADTECLFCTHAPTTPENWELFKAKMQELYNVTVSDKYKPQRFR